jgi:hypothetical protein
VFAAMTEQQFRATLTERGCGQPAIDIMVRVRKID